MTFCKFQQNLSSDSWTILVTDRHTRWKKKQEHMTKYPVWAFTYFLRDQSLLESLTDGKKSSGKSSFLTYLKHLSELPSFPSSGSQCTFICWLILQRMSGIILIWQHGGSSAEQSSNRTRQQLIINPDQKVMTSHPFYPPKLNKKPVAECDFPAPSCE